MPSDARESTGLARMLWLLYQKRIVNVNVNIITAGVLALAPTAYAARLAESYFGRDRH